MVKCFWDTRLAKPFLWQDAVESFSPSAATCTHYGGPLAKGLMVDCVVRCPWHHARFDLRTGEAIAAPALNNVACYKVEKRGERFFVTGKMDKKAERRPKSSPASVVIIGAGAAGGRRRLRCCVAKVTTDR
jgi:nitrite reductase/ring-hydroxylating ferredoxin subunit